MKKDKSKVISDLAKKYPDRKSAILPALHYLQKENNNYLSPEDINIVSKIFGLTKSNILGVASYYTMFNRKQVGKYHLQVDTCLPGFLAGADEIVTYLSEKLEIKPGQTTDDGVFTLSRVQDLGSCGTAPVIQVNDKYYENMTIDKVDELLDSLRAGEMPESDNVMKVDSDCNILLKNRLLSGATDINVYKENGGYQGLKKALEQEPGEIVAKVREASVRGRGGAGFPAGMKWTFLPKNDERPVYLICNADEGEPGTFKDRQIMEYDPHLVIEGMAIAARGIKAQKAFIYIRGEFSWIAEILEGAIEQARSDGQLDHVDIIVHRGAGSYVCGDETALIESLEGKRGNPRVKPPFPANSGLYGCPTVVNNVETLACIPFVIDKGPDEFKTMGQAGNFGPKIFGISGHVNEPGVFEYPLRTPLKYLLERAGGVKGNLKGIIVGGSSVPILRADEIEGIKLDYDSCLRAGTFFGSGGIMVINDTVSIPELALRTIEFYAHESCGQCLPCKEGTHNIKQILKRIIAGKGLTSDIDTIIDLCNKIQGLTICPTGEAFAIPVLAMVEKFREEFEALIKLNKKNKKKK